MITDLLFIYVYNPAYIYRIRVVINPLEGRLPINMSLFIEYCCFCIGLLTFRFNLELVEE
jgi:hypothetical protein